jgi:hypothetical protein
VSSSHGRARRAHPAGARVPTAGARESLSALEAELRREQERRQWVERRLGRVEAQLATMRQAIATASRAEAAGADQVASGPAAPAARHRVIELTRDRASQGDAYWLRRCEGFRVFAESRVLGTVEAVRFGRHHDRPDTLILAPSGPRHRRLHVPVEAIAEISPDEERITVSADPRAPRAARLRGQLRAVGRRLRPGPGEPTDEDDPVESLAEPVAEA